MNAAALRHHSPTLRRCVPIRFRCVVEMVEVIPACLGLSASRCVARVKLVESAACPVIRDVRRPASRAGPLLPCQNGLAMNAYALGGLVIVQLKKVFVWCLCVFC